MEYKEEIWKSLGTISKDLLSLFGVIATSGLFISYHILTSYITEIEFSVDVLETHLIFSIAKYIIILFLVLSILITIGTIFPYNTLKQYNNRTTLIKLWKTSSLIILVFLLSSLFGVTYFSLSSFESLIYMCVLALCAACLEYKLIKNIVNKETIAVILFQMTYSLVVYAYLLGLLLKTKVEWISIVFISAYLIIIHSYVYIIILFSSKPWRKYVFFFLAVFPVMVLLISLNYFREDAISASNIGGIEYKEIKITDEECEYLNKYYDSKLCSINMLTNMKGLWLQGSVQYFQDKNGKYKVKADNIIYKVKSTSSK